MSINLPYDGFSWQVTQHAGCVDDRLVTGLLRAVDEFDGKSATNDEIDSAIQKQGFLDSSTDRSLWRDYQQVLYELGLAYPTSLTNGVIHITKTAKEFLCGNISFCELLTLQLMLYQYPNGYKLTISKEIDGYISNKGESYSNLIELQRHYSVEIRPMVFVWRLICSLYKRNHTAGFLTLAELQQIVLRCSSLSDEADCLRSIDESRSGVATFTGATGPVKRNASDWATLFGRTMLFDYEQKRLSFSDVSMDAIDELSWLFDELSNTDTYWPGGPNDACLWFENVGDDKHPIRKLITDHDHDMYRVFPSIIMNEIIAKKQFILKGGV